MRVSTIVSLVVFALACTAAQAQIKIDAGPGNFTGDENVLFNGDGLITDGPLVQGITNQTHTLVDFWNAGTDLHVNGGQSRLEAQSGTFSSLDLGLHDSGSTFSTLIFNLNAVADGTVTFTVDSDGGVFTQTFDLDKNGENFFRFEGLNGAAMSTVSFTSTVGIQDVKQVRIGGIQAVPEPATMAGLGLGALALLRRKRPKKG
jgi:hypothetical protein